MFYLNSQLLLYFNSLHNIHLICFNIRPASSSSSILYTIALLTGYCTVWWSVNVRLPVNVMLTSNSTLHAYDRKLTAYSWLKSRKYNFFNSNTPHSVMPKTCLFGYCKFQSDYHAVCGGCICFLWCGQNIKFFARQRSLPEPQHFALTFIQKHT